jgi:hypothetical protein
MLARVAPKTMRLTLAEYITWVEGADGCVKGSGRSIQSDSPIELDGTLLRSNSGDQSQNGQNRPARHCKERIDESNERELMKRGGIIMRALMND